MNNLPRVAARQCTGRELNPRPIDRESNALATTLPSHLNYGVEIYGNCCQTYMNKLMVLNNKILRILQNALRDSKVVDLCNNFNTLTLPNLHKFNILLFVRKFFPLVIS